MQHALIYILAFALGGLQLTPAQQRFHCRMTGQRDLVRCCCEGRDAEPNASCVSRAGACGSGEQAKGCRSNQPCDRESPDAEPVVAVSGCCDITNAATTTPTMVEPSRNSRDIETVACGHPIAIPAARDGELHGGLIRSGIVELSRNGPPGVTPPRFILHCSFLI